MRKRALRYLVLCLLGLVAIGCDGTSTESPQPVPGTIPTPFPGYTFPLVDLANRVIPLPNNFLLDPATGLVNLPGGGGAEDNTIDAANSLDGFSTTGPIIIPFRGTVIPSTVNTQTLPVFNSVTGQPALVAYSVDNSSNTGSVVTIVPIRPLDPSTTYVVVLTQGIISALSNTPILSDNVINFIQQPTPLVDGQGNSTTRLLTNEQAATLEPVRQGNQPVIAGAEALTGTDRTNIPFAFAFTTQTLFVALPQARAITVAENAGLVNSFGTFPIAAGQGPGDGDPSNGNTVDEFWSTLPAAVQAAPNDAIGAIFAGTIAVPQFRANPFTDFWAQPPVNGGSINVPFLLFLPPTATPDPAVIFQHGLTRNKGDAFVLANAFNSQGFGLIAIDLPLHGDLRPDPTLPDGTGFINPGAPRVSRDNIRQGAVGQMAVTQAIISGQTDLTGDAIPELLFPAIAPAGFERPFFIGTSMGAVTGILFSTVEPNVARVVANVPWGRNVVTLLESPAFGPPVLEGLANAGLVPGTADFARFVIFTTAVLDDVDTLNYAEPAIAGTLRGGVGLPILQQISTEDTVALPVSQYDLANSFGEDPDFAQVAALLPLALVTQATAPDPGPGVFEIPDADHGAILSPLLGPTVAIITQAITYLGTGNIIDAGMRAQAVQEGGGAEDPAPYANTVVK